MAFKSGSVFSRCAKATGGVIDESSGLETGSQGFCQENAGNDFFTDLPVVIRYLDGHRPFLLDDVPGGRFPEGFEPLRQGILECREVRLPRHAEVVPQILARDLKGAAALGDAAVGAIRPAPDFRRVLVRGLREFFLKFQLDCFPDGLDAFLHIHDSRAFHEQMLFRSYVGRRDHCLADAECVDAAFENGADRFHDIDALFLDGRLFRQKLIDLLPGDAPCFESRNLRIDGFELAFDLFLGDAKIELCSANEIQSEMEFGVPHEFRCPSFEAVRQSDEYENDRANRSHGQSKRGG